VQTIVDVLVGLTWTLLVPPMVALALLPWRRLLSTERALLLMGVGLVMAVLTVAAERWRQRGDRAQRFTDELHIHRGNMEAYPHGCIPLTREQWRELERICRG
jgi:hypothetical protein